VEIKKRVSVAADTVSCARCKEIKSKIHFSNNLEANTNNSERDKLQKIRPIFDRLVQNFNRITMDESLYVNLLKPMLTISTVEIAPK